MTRTTNMTKNNESKIGSSSKLDSLLYEKKKNTHSNFIKFNLLYFEFVVLWLDLLKIRFCYG